VARDPVGADPRQAAVIASPFLAVAVLYGLVVIGRGSSVGLRPWRLGGCQRGRARDELGSFVLVGYEGSDRLESLVGCSLVVVAVDDLCKTSE
jgi:hypothetical protein